MPLAPTPEDLAQARAALAAADPALARTDRATPPFEWRLRVGGFEGLFRMIVEQQVSVASAAAVWARLREGMGEISPEALLRHDLEQLRGMGLSRQKATMSRIAPAPQPRSRIDVR